MDIKIDPDVLAVIKFMNFRFKASRLVSIANSIQSLASVLWGQYSAEYLFPMFVSTRLTFTDETFLQSDANGSDRSPKPHAHGDFEAAANEDA